MTKEEKDIQREKQLNDAIELLKKYGNEEDVDRAISNLKDAKAQIDENKEKVKKQINRTKILKDVITNTSTYKLLSFFLALFFVLALAVMLAEPGINNYIDSLWLCFAAVTTIGFGDVVATTIVGRVCLVVLSLYAIILTAILTSVIVAYYNQVLEAQQKGSIVEFFDKLERLPELSHEELVELSERVKKYRDS